MQARVKADLPMTSINAFAQVFVKTEWRDVREGVIPQRLANNPFLEYREKPTEEAAVVETEEKSKEEDKYIPTSPIEEQTAVIDELIADEQPKRGRAKKQHD